MFTTQAHEIRLAELVSGSRFSQVAWVAETGSTNRDLLAVAGDKATNEQALVADFQSQGRGRRGRVWENAAGSALMVSVLVRPSGSLAQAHRYTSALGLAARDACEIEVGVSPRIKWPNDLVFGNAKVAGILAETAMRGTDFVGLVLGIGINVTHNSNWSPEVRQRATSLVAEAVDTPEVDRVALAAALLRRFAHWCDVSDDDLREAHLRHSATVGSRVSVERTLEGGAAHVLVGQAVDVDETGRLVVEADGALHTLSVGDVTHLRRS